VVARLQITWIKSDIGYDKTQKAAIKSLGLKRLNQTVVHEDSLAMRGMVNKGRHLVKVEAIA